MKLTEKVALALKADMAKQFNAKPLLGDTNSGDWHATGGTLDLSAMARTALESSAEWIEARWGNMHPGAVAIRAALREEAGPS